MSRGKIKFRTQNDEVCALYLLPPVYGGRAGGRSLFEIGKIIGYRQNLFRITKFKHLRDTPPRFTVAGAGVGSLLEARIFRIQISRRLYGIEAPPRMESTRSVAWNQVENRMPYRFADSIHACA